MPANRDGKRYLTNLSDDSLRWHAEDVVIQKYRQSPEFATEVEALLKKLNEAVNAS